MDYTVRGIFQARILEWVAFPFSRGSSQPGIEHGSPTSRADSLPAEPPGKASPCGGFSYFRARAPEHRFQQFWHSGLAAPSAHGVFLDQGSRLCPLHWQEDSFFCFFGRRILNHWITKVVLRVPFYCNCFFYSV